MWWIVHERDRGERVVRIQPKGAVIFARLNAPIGGVSGTFVEAHQLDVKIAAKVPKRMTGRTLTLSEAGKLLDRLT